MFWDLYCAAPERRETCEHSSEAKAFHDYVSFMFIGYILSQLYLEMITAMNLVIFNVLEKLLLPNFCIPLIGNGNETNINLVCNTRVCFM